MSEQPFDEGVTGRPDVFALAQAPLGVAQLVGDRLGRQVLVDGRAAARSELSKVGGDELVVAEQLHGGLGGPQPQMLAYQTEAGGVVRLLELHVAVGVELDPCPHGELRWASGKGAQELALGLDEAGQGLLVGGAVDAVAGGAEQPGAQLRIGVDEVAELAQRDERTLEVLHRRFHPALFFRVAHRTGLDLESVALGALRVGALHLGVVVAGPGDRALRIVDGQALGHAVEPLERTAVTSQPGGDLLVGDDLGVGVTRPRQRHDEDPGAQQLTGARVEDLGTLAEVDLRGLAGVELEHGGDLRVSGLEACEEAAHRGVRAGEAVAAHQGGVDGGALDALTPPTRDPLAMRLRQRGHRGLCAYRAQVHRKLAVARQRRGGVEPARRLGGEAKLRRLAPTHQPGTGDGAVGVAQPHTGKYLTIFEHLEPPIGHRHLPLSECAGEGTGEKWWSETSAQQCRSGSIKANIGWRH